MSRATTRRARKHVHRVVAKIREPSKGVESPRRVRLHPPECAVGPADVAQGPVVDAREARFMSLLVASCMPKKPLG